MNARNGEQLLRLPAVSMADAIAGGIVNPLFLYRHTMRAGELRRVHIAKRQTHGTIFRLGIDEFKRSMKSDFHLVALVSPCTLLAVVCGARQTVMHLGPCELRKRLDSERPRCLGALLRLKQMLLDLRSGKGAQSKFEMSQVAVEIP